MPQRQTKARFQVSTAAWMKISFFWKMTPLHWVTGGVISQKSYLIQIQVFFFMSLGVRIVSSVRNFCCAVDEPNQPTSLFLGYPKNFDVSGYVVSKDRFNELLSRYAYTLLTPYDYVQYNKNSQPTTLQNFRLPVLPSAFWLQVLYGLIGQTLGFRNPKVYLTNSQTDPLRIFVNINYNNLILSDLDVEKQVSDITNNKARLQDRHFCCRIVQQHTSEKLLAFCITTR